ncbi:hypothetical protein [Mangrovimonas spongiae]|uniref:Uncharacterized protein n=1 Tax=Mangrovimonas spongiae TaxID=2494697 RepID=A0A3R9NRU5_9FLAO|nr:hypothetical protein [Mangrovimonas spongiae]RSK40293.1 hypothetical protein EJA19_04760 [Mangrovimonas spongiae]
MKAERLSNIKKELQHQSKDELLQLCLRLGRFKKENKELLTYLLFEAHDEDGYVASIIKTLDEDFEAINTASYFYIKKSIRKILRQIRTYSRYSNSKATEVELLLYFCKKLKDFKPNIFRNKALSNLYDRQIVAIKKKITALHDDLQHDYLLELEELLVN